MGKKKIAAILLGIFVVAFGVGFIQMPFEAQVVRGSECTHDPNFYQCLSGYLEGGQILNIGHANDYNINTLGTINASNITSTGFIIGDGTYITGVTTWSNMTYNESYEIIRQYMLNGSRETGLYLINNTNDNSVIVLDNYANSTTFPGLTGDILPDCEVNDYDFAVIGSCMWCDNTQECWSSCEIANVYSLDNEINIFDMAVVGINYGNKCSASTNSIDLIMRNSSGSDWETYSDVGNAFGITSTIERNLLKSIRGDLDIWSMGGNISLRTFNEGDIVMYSDGSIRPAYNATMDFGDPNYQWRNMWISGSIYGQSTIVPYKDNHGEIGNSTNKWSSIQAYDIIGENFNATGNIVSAQTINGTGLGIDNLHMNANKLFSSTGDIILDSADDFIFQFPESAGQSYFEIQDLETQPLWRLTSNGNIETTGVGSIIHNNADLSVGAYNAILNDGTIQCAIMYASNELDVGSGSFHVDDSGNADAVTVGCEGDMSLMTGTDVTTYEVFLQYATIDEDATIGNVLTTDINDNDWSAINIHGSLLAAEPGALEHSIGSTTNPFHDLWLDGDVRLDAGTNTYIYHDSDAYGMTIYQDSGSSKWQMGKMSDNGWGLYDNAGTTYVIECETNSGGCNFRDDSVFTGNVDVTGHVNATIINASTYQYHTTKNKSVVMDWYTSSCGSGVMNEIHGRRCDATTDEYMIWQAVVPLDYKVGGEVWLEVPWSMYDAQTGRNGVSLRGFTNVINESDVGTVFPGYKAYYNSNHNLANNEAAETLHYFKLNMGNENRMPERGSIVTWTHYRDANNVYDNATGDMFMPIVARLTYESDES